MRFDSATIERLHHELEEIPTLYAQLPAVLTGEIRGQSGGPSVPGSRPPIAVTAHDLLDRRIKDAHQWATRDPITRDVANRWGVAPTLALWVRYAHAAMDTAGEAHTTIGDLRDAPVDTLTDHLKQLLPFVLTQPWARELTSDIRTLWRRLRRELGIRPEFRPKCRWCAYRCEPQDEGTWYLCPNCGADFTWLGEIAALVTLQNATAQQIAGQLGISSERIRQWASRGLVTKVGKRNGQPLYSVDAVARVYRDISARRIKVPERVC